MRATLIAHIHQRPGDNLLDHLTVAQQLTRIAAAARRTDVGVADALAALGLDDVADRLPRHLSGGERQRAAVARVLVSQHGIVIADEPTSQLDSPNAGAVMDAFDLLAAGGTTVVVATHDPRVLERVDQIVRMRDGAVTSVTEQGSAFAVIDRAGRVQLPPAAHRQFDRRARLSFDPTTGRVVLERP